MWKMSLVGDERVVLGLDLGQRQDWTALAVVAAAWEREPVTMARGRNWGARVVYLERMRRGSAYASVGEWVRRVLERNGNPRRGTLVVDATGVGAPVVEMLRAARLGVGLVPVTITGGAKATETGVPRVELLTRFAVGLETGRLRLVRGVTGGRELEEEMGELRREVRSGQLRAVTRGHDDLVMTVALAWWWMEKNSVGIWGPGRVV